MKPYKFIISGGGTGGHIYPAIAIADALKRKYDQAEFLFVGAKDRMEMTKVPEAGYPIQGLWISGIQRKLSLKNLSFPFKLWSSLRKSRKIIRKFKPDVAIGTGGYASAPLLRVASKKGVPSLIQEQNSHAGVTNRWLSGKVNTICTAYEGMETFFPKEKIVLTGNPVRQDILNLSTQRSEALSFFGFSEEKQVLLVIGGSLGARKINDTIAQSIGWLANQNVQVLWQCGSINYEAYKHHNHDRIKVVPFLDRMDLAYAAADVIISRAGALSVSELCLVGKPVIFIPSPNVTANHQLKNALKITEKNAALLLRETEVDQNFKSVLGGLLSDTEMQQRLAENIRQLAKPDATEQIVHQIEKLLMN